MSVLLLSVLLTTGPTLSVGASAVDVTPPLPVSVNGYFYDRSATSAHDRLHARALVVSNGEAALALAVVDNCFVPTPLLTKARTQAAAAIGIPVAHILVSATHTHSGPSLEPTFGADANAGYGDQLVAGVVRAITAAHGNLAPAEIAFGVAEVPDQVFNRRWHMKPGFVLEDPLDHGKDRVKMNPPPGSEQLLRPAGPTDPQVSFVAARRADDRSPIALFACYSLHYVGGVPNDELSADYFGVFSGRVGKLLPVGGEGHPEFVGGMFNGASGDINNIDFENPRGPMDSYEQIGRVAGDVAEAVAQRYKSLEWHGHVPLAARVREIAAGVRKPSPAEIERAERIVAEAGDSIDDLVLTAPASYDRVYAGETLMLAGYPDEVTLPLQVLRIGELGICAVPCETFVEIGLELKAKSPFERTFTVGLANGYHGYLPTAAQHALGGYETWRARSSYLAVDAAAKMTAALLAMLDGLHEENAES